MLDQNVAREVLQEAVRTGGDFAEIFMEDRIDHAMGMRSHKLESATTSRTHGAGVRVYVGLNAIYAYTNDTSREGLIACARQAAWAKASTTAWISPTVMARGMGAPALARGDCTTLALTGSMQT